MYRTLALLFLLLPMCALASPDGVVNVRNCPGVVGNGKTDDGPKIQECLDANRGKHIFFPRTRKQADPPDWPDYFVEKTTLELHGFNGWGPWIEGEGSGGGGVTRIKFGPKMEGPAIRILNAEAQGTKISNISLEGSRPWVWNDLQTCILPVPCTSFRPCTNGPDGIQILANGVTLENVRVAHFGRHGINIDTSGISVAPVPNANADQFTLINVTSYGNRGDGFHIDGGDSQSGVIIRCDASYNQLWGFNESSFLGNTYIQPHTSGNHKNESPCHWPPGTTGGAYRATWTVYQFPGGPPIVGEAPRKIDDHPGPSVFISPYAEGDQPPSALGIRQVVIGGFHGPELFNAEDPLQGGGPGWIKSDGENGLEIRFQGLRLLALPEGSLGKAPYGTVVLNSKPTAGGYIGWVQVNQDPAKLPDWRPFGKIQP